MSKMGTGIKFGLKNEEGLKGAEIPHSASLERTGRARCGRCSEEGGCGLAALPRPTTTISKRIINHNNKHQQLQRPHWRMSPKPARIQLAQPTPVFSAEREGMGTGQAGVGAADLRARGTGRDVGPSCGSWGSLSSLSSHSPQLSIPPSPQPPAPAPLSFTTFALFTNMSLEFKWVIYSVAASLSHRGPVPAWCRVRPKTAREEKERAKECFSALFIPSPPTLFYFVCVCVGRTLHWLSPPLSPPPCFHPLGPALAPFMLHDSWNGSPGGSYRECIGSLGERKPPTSYTPDV